MSSYPVEPMYDAYGKPLGPSEYPHASYPMAPQYPGMPPQYPMMQPGPYPPHMMDPAYSQGKSKVIIARKICSRNSLQGTILKGTNPGTPETPGVFPSSESRK